MKRIVYFTLVAIIVLLSLTGYSAIFTMSRSMTGYSLLLHAALAPVFALGIAIWAVGSASRNRFSARDGAWLFARCGWNSTVECEPSASLLVARKVCFWLVLAMAAPAILSIVLNMFPLFSTDWQLFLMQIHRSSVTILTLGILGYAGLSYTIASR